MRGKVMLDRKCLSQLGITPAYAGKSSLRPSTHDRSRDHPRVCGEKAYSRVISGSLWGSPPRVRGKEVSRRLGLAVDGITPACAGKSSTATLAAHSTGDHPRVCGEKPQPATHSAAPPGSPPRMRGKEVKALLHFNWVGITPAYAGKSSPGSAAGCHARDHPRVCGEKSTTSEDAGSLPGSPPRMRGKV